MNANVTPMSNEATDPPVGGWVLEPRHQRRVIEAARRATWADEHGKLDDWIEHWLKRCRREALDHHTQEEIDEWTMRGLLAGRQEQDG